MPIAHIYLLEGRTAEQKKAVIETVTAALHETLGGEKGRIRVLLHDMSPEEWGVGGQPVGGPAAG